MIEKEIDSQGRQIMASQKKADRTSVRFINAVQSVISSIRHLGFMVRYDQWTSSVSVSNILLTFKVSAVGIGNYSIDFQWEAQGESIATFYDHREVRHTAIGESEFPLILKHLPSSQFAKLASDAVFPCLRATTNLTLEQISHALRQVPSDLATAREVAIDLARLLEKTNGLEMTDNSLSLIDIIMRDLIER
jgi:hypothetical protein